MKMRSLRLATLLSSALLVPQPGNAREPEAAPHHAATRVLVGECLFREGSGESAILGALIPFAIEQGLNLVGSALRGAGEGGTATFSGTGNFDLPYSELNETCVLIIQGRFVSDTSAGAPAGAWASTMGMDQGMLDTLATRHRVYLADAPDFMFEGVLRQSNDGKAFTLRPLYAAMNRPVERPLIDPTGGRRSVAILLSLATPGADLTAATNPGTEVMIGELRRGRYIRYRFADDDAGSTSQPSANGGQEGDQLTENRYIPWPLESRWFQLDAQSISGPITARVVVTQTRSPSALFGFLSRAFEAAKSEIQTTARNALIPAEGRAAQVAALQAEQQLTDASNTAVTNALTALDQCATSDATTDSPAHSLQRLTLSRDVQGKQSLANQAALTARRPAAFLDSELIEPTTASSLQRRCGDFRDAVIDRLGGEDG